MSRDRGALDIEGQSRVLRLIVVAMCLGVLLFYATVAALEDPDKESATGSLISYAALAVSIVGIIISAVLSSVIPARVRRSVPPEAGPKEASEKLLVAYRVMTITSLAILEGGALLAVCAYMIEGTALGRALPIGMIAGMFTYFGMSSPSRIQEWIRKHRRLIDAERSLNS